MLTIGSHGTALLFLGNATFAPPISFGGLAALPAHPAVAVQGPTILLRIEQPTMRSGATFNISLASGLRLGGALANGPPLFAVEGDLSSDGVAVLRMSTTVGWTPLPQSAPGLQVPPLHGTLTIDVPRHTLIATAESVAPFGVSLADGMLVLSQCQLTLQATVDMTADDVPPLVATSPRSRA